MRLYHWSDRQEMERMPTRAHHPGSCGESSGRTFTVVLLSVDPPRAVPETATEVAIPRGIVEPFRVREGRYLVPASVVRAYRALREDG